MDDFKLADESYEKYIRPQLEERRKLKQQEDGRNLTVKPTRLLDKIRYKISNIFNK